MDCNHRAEMGSFFAVFCFYQVAFTFLFAQQFEAIRRHFKLFITLFVDRRHILFESLSVDCDWETKHDSNKSRTIRKRSIFFSLYLYPLAAIIYSQRFLLTVYVDDAFASAVAVQSLKIYPGPLSATLIYNPLKQWIWIFHARYVRYKHARHRTRIAHRETEFSLIPIAKQIHTFSGQYIHIWRCFVCAVWTRTAHRLLPGIVISHHAFLSCLSVFSLLISVLVDVGIWPTQTQCFYIQCNATVSIRWTFVDFSCDSNVYVCCMCAKGEYEEGKRSGQKSRKKWEKNADTDGNEIKNEQCTHTNKQTKKYHYSLVDGTSCILRAEQGNELDVELDIGNGMDWIIETLKIIK